MTAGTFEVIHRQERQVRQEAGATGAVVLASLAVSIQPLVAWVPAFSGMSEWCGRVGL